MGTLREFEDNLNLDSKATGKDSCTRANAVIRASLTGVAANVALAGFKAAVGILTNSIAIVLDAVNNLSDAASSVITIVGTKLAGKPADKKHPFGYGRIEYMTAMVIAILVLYAGITSFTESVQKILHPEKPAYTITALVIIAAAVIVKILLGRYVKSVGEKYNSDSLINSGTDAMMDSIISASTLAAALICTFTGISLEAWLGAVISVVIIKSGVEMLRDTISKLLGERADASLASKIRKIVDSFPQVQGAYDLALNNYGPDRFSGSIHIEVVDTMTADEIDALTRAITMKVYKETDVLLYGISVYSVNTKDPKASGMREKISGIVHRNPYVLQMHGFFVHENPAYIRFDLVISFDAKDRMEEIRKITREVEEAYPDYKVMIALDTDFSTTSN